MPELSSGRWDIYQPPELDPQLAALAGRRAGLRRCLELLSQDACHPDVGGYRLSGPFAPIVCGAHLDRRYRVAYSTQPALTASDRPRVVVLYVGKKEPGSQRDGDVWTCSTICSTRTTPPWDMRNRRAATPICPRSITTC